MQFKNVEKGSADTMRAVIDVSTLMGIVIQLSRPETRRLSVEREMHRLFHIYRLIYSIFIVLR